MSADTVLVTGFGPFGTQKINASWEAVRLLENKTIDNVSITIKEIPVTYKYVDENIPLLWKQLNPKLVIHVGVLSDPKYNYIRIETQANRCEYKKLDCEGCLHPTTEACNATDGHNCIASGLHVESISKYVDTNSEIKVRVSNDAGRYLCEYIYYKSLNINKDRCLFVHVPILGNPYTKEEIANVLYLIIKGALMQLA